VGKGRIVSKKAVEGLVLPNKWDENGKIIGIAIHTDKEEIYLVARNRMESELLSYLNLKVEIQGKMMERLDGSKIIHVSSFQPILDESNDIQKKQQCEPLLEV
jgi:hypothetical protein